MLVLFCANFSEKRHWYSFTVWKRKSTYFVYIVHKPVRALQLHCLATFFIHTDSSDSIPVQIQQLSMSPVGISVRWREKSFRFRLSVSGVDRRKVCYCFQALRPTLLCRAVKQFRATPKCVCFHLCEARTTRGYWLRFVPSRKVCAIGQAWRRDFWKRKRWKRTAISNYSASFGRSRTCASIMCRHTFHCDLSKIRWWCRCWYIWL